MTTRWQCLGIIGLGTAFVLVTALATVAAPVRAITPTPLPTPSPGERCGDPSVPGTALTLTTEDGVTLNAATLGEGSAGVVIAHEYPANYCEEWQYALHLQDEGYRVVLFDFRCFGGSSCPPGDARANLVADLRAAVAEVQREGANTVVLLGASMGGSAVLEAAAAIRPPVAGVISLSGEVNLGRFLPLIPLKPEDTIAQVESPLLIVTSDKDFYLSVDEAQSLIDAAGTTDKQLIVLPNSSAHGFLLLGTPASPTTVDRDILAFLRAHSGGGPASPVAS